ncbi:hypothetical protein Poly30_02390 [Planctomycetes bacterium Poly30]|uniref:Uncharacterized protein n=2 Tax=Saltatorellus ferox TaxID=2528018 RepID=A0A518EKX9_9BACT|nr:hypothetical protein Poly30_02390 [Planctomycetes bacterium Poly30]
MAAMTLAASTSCIPGRSTEVHSPLANAEETKTCQAVTRAQFEAAAKGRSHQGSGAHLVFNCPHCVDPMNGQVPEEALIDGPMQV